jgi:hypothetical protein
MGVQVYWVLFFITDNQEFQHESPGVLGFIFDNGQPRNPTWESRCSKNINVEWSGLPFLDFFVVRYKK